MHLKKVGYKMDFYKREFHFLLASITKLENLSHWREESSQEILKNEHFGWKEIKKKLLHWYSLLGKCWSQLGAQTWPLTSVICSVEKKCRNSWALLTSTFQSHSSLVGFPNEWESRVCVLTAHRACYCSPVLTKGGFRLEHDLALTHSLTHFYPTSFQR